ncbi:MAG: Gfo/Idh/MocA family oxidoreductase [Bryobacteraceae bacterium]|jgi:predicted dehydrogenase
MKRRTFIVAGGALAMRAFGANDRINVAVIGVGGRGTAHLGLIGHQENATVAAVCDVNQAQTERAVARVEKDKGYKPKVYSDMRELFEDKDIDAVTVATPNHWHALTTIWAVEAGKDVYCEKPATYNIFEGQRMTAHAREANRIVQIGMQSRSTPHKQRAVQLLHDGAIGKLYMARGICFKRRPSIGHTPVIPVPVGVNWDLFLGPAAMEPYTKNHHVYNWHWFWNTGNGDIGNQGIHEMDMCRWGLGAGLPSAASSTGGKYAYDDDQETPNTQIATLSYGNAEIVFEVRGLATPSEGAITFEPPTGQALSGGNSVGNQFFGDKGYMSVDHTGFSIFLGDKHEPGESAKAEKGHGDDSIAHVANFLSAVRSRKYEDLNADVAEGAASANLVHMANTSYRLGRRLTFDPASQNFENDSEANKMKTRNPYRAPYVVS